MMLIFKPTKSVMIGKNDGAFIGSIPKYLAALAPSNLPYFALASSVHGGLLPAPSLDLCRYLQWCFCTAANVDPSEEHGMDSEDVRSCSIM